MVRLLALSTELASVFNYPEILFWRMFAIVASQVHWIHETVWWASRSRLCVRAYGNTALGISHLIIDY